MVYLYFTYEPSKNICTFFCLENNALEVPIQCSFSKEEIVEKINPDTKFEDDIWNALISSCKDKKNTECTVLFSSESGISTVNIRCLYFEKKENSNDEVIVVYGYNISKYQEDKNLLRNELYHLKSIQGTIVSASCFNVTKDKGIDLEGTAKTAKSIQPYKKDDPVYVDAISMIPELANQKTDTLNVLLFAASCIPDKAERKKFLYMSSHFGMIQNFNEGNRDVTLKYSRYLNGELKYLLTRVSLLKDPDTDDIIAFIYTTDIDKETRTEQIEKIALKSGCDYVSITNVGSKRTKLWYLSDELMPYLDNLSIEIGKDYDRDFFIECAKKISAFGTEDETEMGDINELVDSLNRYGTLTFTYNINLPGQSTSRKYVKYCFLDEKKKDIVRLQSDITHSYEKEQEQLKKLEQALNELQIANHAKNNFVSRISHDIRTPISAITNLTNFAKEDINDKEKLLDDIKKIEVSSKFLLSLINDVLDISKIDSGKITLNPVPYTENEYMDNIENIFIPMCKEKDIEYKIIRHEKTDYTIIADKVRLNQIILNLISNAVKYTPKGGKITYKSIGKKIDDKRARYGFELSDTGIGMSEEFQKHMFDEFAQEYDNPNRPKNLGGTGLGLAIVKKLIQLMDGALIVESKLGVGTTIRCQIDFPYISNVQSIDKKDEEKASSKIAPLHGHILIAEDNEINQEIAMRILESFGLTFDLAIDGKIAASMFRDSQKGFYDLILMDIQMPNMNGYEATTAIRNMDRDDAKNIPILAMTADVFDDAIKKGYACGMNAYITKPIDSKILHETISNFLK